MYYPGLAGHPGHDIARRQQSSFGAMLSFELAGGEPAVAALLEGLTCFTLAESLGGVESLIAHPASMTHAGMDEAARRRAGIGEGCCACRSASRMHATSPRISRPDSSGRLPAGQAPRGAGRHGAS